MREFFQQIASFLGAERYSQHSICLSSDYLMLLLYTASDLVIFASYGVIGFCLLSKRQIIAEMNSAALTLFGAFIALCGMNHFTMVLTLFAGVYRLDIAVKAATAAVSAVTAFYTLVALYGETGTGREP